MELTFLPVQRTDCWGRLDPELFSFLVRAHSRTHWHAPMHKEARALGVGVGVWTLVGMGHKCPCMHHAWAHASGSSMDGVCALHASMRKETRAWGVCVGLWFSSCSLHRAMQAFKSLIQPEAASTSASQPAPESSPAAAETEIHVSSTCDIHTLGSTLVRNVIEHGKVRWGALLAVVSTVGSVSA